MMFLVATAITVLADSPSSRMDRAEFAKAMSSVQVGFTQSQVKQILGLPHDVVTYADGDRLPFGMRFIWCFGTAGHLTFPTLGCIYFGPNNRVVRIFGGGGSTLPLEATDEAALQSLLRSIDRIGSLDGQSFNPAYMIESVNRLTILGKEGAIDVLEEYLRVASDMSGTDTLGTELVLRILFEVPEEPGYFPKFDVARTFPQLTGSEEARRQFPRFPMVLFKDIPILVISDCILLGQRRGKSRNFDYFRKHGRIRQANLKPPDNPLTIRKELMRSESWSYFVGLKESDKEMVCRQLLRMVNGVPGANALVEVFNWNSFSGREWNELLEQVASLRIEWNSHLDRYVCK